jgi:hypothetical protein
MMERRDHTKAIIKLSIEYEGGKVVYHSEEWAISENIVIITDLEGTKWIRKNGKRRAVMKTGKLCPTPFTKLISGRR